MNICIITSRYPSKYNDSDFVFVKKLVDEFARQGNNCVVVSPFSISRNKGLLKSVSQYRLGEGSVIELRPNYISIGNAKLFGIDISNLLLKWAINRGLRKMTRSGFVPDVVYCHFWGSGLLGYRYAKKHDIPLFVASGESRINMSNMDGHLDDFCNYVRGVICVSSKNRDESITLKLTSANKCIVAPNAVNDTIFHEMDKMECRKKIGLPQDKFIVAFVGWFIERKGPDRVAAAIDGIESYDVYSLFIGSGELEPKCINILFKGKVDNSELPIYLNAADVFVLPTLQEGCCNAVVEALSCGLPVISSNLPFNWDVLDSSNAILVDPENAEEIRKAILEIKNDSAKRENLSSGSIKKASRLTLSSRASDILNFITSKL